jgi:hypothetical protein
MKEDWNEKIMKNTEAEIQKHLKYSRNCGSDGGLKNSRQQLPDEF